MLENIVIYKIFFLFFLGILSFQDIKYKKISIYILVLMFISEILMYIYLFIEKNKFDVISLFYIFIFTFILFLFARFTKEKIAYGDVIVLFLLGLYMDKERFFMFLSLLMLVLGLVSGFIIMINIIKGSYRRDIAIPMLPFIFVAVLFMEFGK